MLDKTNVPPIVARPAIVTGIAVTAVSFGALATFAALWNLVLPPLLHVPLEMPGDMPPPLNLFADFWRYRVALAGTQVVFGALVLLAGWGMFRRRAWARATLECAAWSVLLSYVLVGAMWVYRWHGATYDERNSWAQPFALFGGLVILFWAIVFGLAIKLLRSRRLRDALVSTNA